MTTLNHLEFIEVRESAIHRKGVFAVKDVPKGTRIAEYVGIKMTKDEGSKKLEETNQKHRDDPENHAATYIFELDDEYDLDGDVPENDAKYANHSCDPNCEIDIIGHNIYLETLKDIKKGDEITFNYGFGINNEDPYDFKENRCRCGSTNCFGYMLGDEYWDEGKKLIADEEKNKTMFDIREGK